MGICTTGTPRCAQLDHELAETFTLMYGEAAGEAKYFLAGLGVAPDVAHLHRRAARLKECQRGLAVGDAFHGEEQDLLHDPSTIPFRTAIGLDPLQRLC